MNMDGKKSSKYRGLALVPLFGVVYLFIAVWFPNPPASNPSQFAWRVAAWILCALAFAIQIGLEHFRLGSTPRRTAVRVAAAVALGAFGVAAAANIHALRAQTGNHGLMALALVIWPVAAGVPAFVVAWVAASGLARMRSE
jgi:hypothetical protein